MTDQCKNCTGYRNAEICEALACQQHENWYAQMLKARTDDREVTITEQRILLGKAYNKLKWASGFTSNDEQRQSVASVCGEIYNYLNDELEE